MNKQKLTTLAFGVMTIAGIAIAGYATWMLHGWNKESLKFAAIVFAFGVSVAFWHGMAYARPQQARVQHDGHSRSGR